jgi:hypothetical protein
VVRFDLAAQWARVELEGANPAWRPRHFSLAEPWFAEQVQKDGHEQRLQVALGSRPFSSQTSQYGHWDRRRPPRTEARECSCPASEAAGESEFDVLSVLSGSLLYRRVKSLEYLVCSARAKWALAARGWLHDGARKGSFRPLG